MKELIHKSGVVLAVMMSLAVMMPGTANATQAGAGVVTGSGTISPGLTDVPRAQSVTFSGTATGLLASTTPLGVGTACTITASGSGFGSLIVGLGAGSASCTGVNLLDNSSQTVGCTFTDLRVGAIVVITGGCLGVFVFVPTTTNPTTTYDLAGVAVLAT